MTEAAAKVELRPETLLAHATHIAAADVAVAQALRGQLFLRRNGCADWATHFGRSRSSRNSVPSVKPRDSGPGASPGRSFMRRRGTPPRSLMHLRPSCFRQGAGTHVQE
jgi:hypothetical protein